MTQTALDSALRNHILTLIANYLSGELDAEALSIGTAEISFPVVDAEGNEKYANVKVSIPRGKRDGNGGYIPYNAYDERDAFNEDLKRKQAKHEEVAERQARKRPVKKAAKEDE